MVEVLSLATVVPVPDDSVDPPGITVSAATGGLVEAGKFDETDVLGEVEIVREPDWLVDEGRLGEFSWPIIHTYR